MARSGLSRRLTALEDVRRRTDLDHLSDEELQSQIVDLVEQLAASIDLGAEWRDQLRNDPVRFIEKCAATIEEHLACGD